MQTAPENNNAIDESDLLCSKFPQKETVMAVQPRRQMTEILEVGSEILSDSRSKSHTEVDLMDEFQQTD